MASFHSRHVFDEAAHPAILPPKRRIRQCGPVGKRFGFRICASARNSTLVWMEEVTLDDAQDREVLLKLATAETLHVDLRLIEVGCLMDGWSPTTGST